MLAFGTQERNCGAKLVFSVGLVERRLRSLERRLRPLERRLRSLERGLGFGELLKIRSAELAHIRFGKPANICSAELARICFVKLATFELPSARSAFRFVERFARTRYAYSNLLRAVSSFGAVPCIPFSAFAACAP